MTPLDLNEDENPRDGLSNSDQSAPPDASKPEFTPVAYSAEEPAETVRRSGLAWSAGIVFVGSVAFMLFIGWLADLVLGSSPWGLVGGIVIGSIIGFIQFFRLTSQIYNVKTPDADIRSLMSETPPDDRFPPL
ncbi:MAG: AtpZ/AtpI family protein [Acidobacteria bacterium]|nr:AtpZ/AtpI family protein [Acidobacteriota bacterium]